MIIDNLSYLTLAYILLAYFFGGLIQGVLGVGLITVVISLLSFVIDVKQTIALVLIPTLLTGFFQMISGGKLKSIFLDVKFFLLFSTLIIIPGVFFLKILNSNLILILIAIILFINSSLSLINKVISIPNHNNSLIQSFVGGINGFLIGLTSIYTMPFVFLLQSLKYPKEKAVQFMGLAFVFYSTMQLITFYSIDLIDYDSLIYSFIISIPVMLGFFLGKKIRDYISEKIFQKLFHIMLIIMSSVILINLLL